MAADLGQGLPGEGLAVQGCLLHALQLMAIPQEKQTVLPSPAVLLVLVLMAACVLAQAVGGQ